MVLMHFVDQNHQSSSFLNNCISKSNFSSSKDKFKRSIFIHFSKMFQINTVKNICFAFFCILDLSSALSWFYLQLPLAGFSERFLFSFIKLSLAILPLYSGIFLCSSLVAFYHLNSFALSRLSFLFAFKLA